MKNLQIRIRRLPNGTLAPEDLELVESEVPAPGRDEMLARTRCMALDADALEPHLRGGSRQSLKPGDVVPARAVCEIVESRNDIFNPGDIVLIDSGLQQYCLSTARGVHRVRTGGAPTSTALSVLGLPGLLAYCGLITFAHVSPGKTVVAAAAGSCSGAMAGHIARIKACRTIGVARTPDEAAWCVRDGHFNACIDLQSDSLDDRLRELAPHGVDICFDAAGGTIAAAVLEKHLAPNGHVVIANATPASEADARVSYIDASRCENCREAFLHDAIAWYAEGHLRCREITVDGLRDAPAHLCQVMRGETFGQVIVRV